MGVDGHHVDDGSCRLNYAKRDNKAHSGFYTCANMSQTVYLQLTRFTEHSGSIDSGNPNVFHNGTSI